MLKPNSAYGYNKLSKIIKMSSHCYIKQKRVRDLGALESFRVDSQTVRNSMSSPKTTMKDRLVIVMRNIYTYCGAYSFEELQNRYNGGLTD